MTQPQPGKLSIDDVAARIKIPALTGLPTRTVIQLRNNEYHHFEKFRSILREAIQETLDKSASGSPDDVAEVVWQDKIRPAVADIERKLAASNRALRNKVVVAVAVGGVAAAVGAVIGLPWLVGVGTLAAGSPLPQIFHAIDDRKELETSPMYFLWRAGRVHRPSVS